MNPYFVNGVQTAIGGFVGPNLKAPGATTTNASGTALNIYGGDGNGTGAGGDINLIPGSTGTGTHGALVATWPLVQDHPVTALYTTTASVTAKELATGWLGYTGAGHTLTLPTATALAAEIGGATQGTIFRFMVQATTGIATIAAVASIVAQKQINTTDVATDVILTVAAGAIGIFEIVFTSGTAARLCRIA